MVMELPSTVKEQYSQRQRIRKRIQNKAKRVNVTKYVNMDNIHY